MTRNFSIKRGTIFAINPSTPISVLYNIMKYWLLDGFNVPTKNWKKTMEINVLYAWMNFK